MRFASLFRHVFLSGVAAGACGLTLAACSGSGGLYGGGGGISGGGGGGGGGAQVVSMSLAFAPFTDSTYGHVLGYMKGTATSGTSQVVHLTASTSVQFYNGDSIPHTASFLGNANGMTYPATFASANSMGGTAAASGSHINATNFSTGPVSPASFSATYNSAGPGFYILGCFFHYDSNGMRTVAVVQ